MSRTGPGRNFAGPGRAGLAIFGSYRALMPLFVAEAQIRPIRFEIRTKKTIKRFAGPYINGNKSCEIKKNPLKMLTAVKEI